MYTQNLEAVDDGIGSLHLSKRDNPPVPDASFWSAFTNNDTNHLKPIGAAQWTCGGDYMQVLLTRGFSDSLWLGFCSKADHPIAGNVPFVSMCQ